MAATDKQGVKTETPTQAAKQEAGRPRKTAKLPTESSVESESIVTAHIDTNCAEKESLKPDALNTNAKSLDREGESSYEQKINVDAEKENPSFSKKDDSAKDENASDNKAGSTSVAGKSPSQAVETHTIHLVDGEKGGAGKSFVSRAFIEYCQYKGLDFAIVDADTSNQDILKIYPGCIEAFFSDDEKQQKEADQIFELALKKSVLVNLPAQVYKKVTEWIDNNGLIELGKEKSIRFVKWFVCTGGHDSVEFFVESQQHFENRLTHVFVRNKGLCDEWSYVSNLDKYKDVQKKYSFVVMDFPKLAHWEKNMVDRLQIKFESACTHPDFGVVSQQKVKNFLKEPFKAFEGTGLVQ